MTEVSYDLTRQAWIPVRRIDGSLEELSLREVFDQAHTLTAVTGELPTTGLALLRLLLAVLQRTVQACRPTLDTPRAVWQDLWDCGRLPAQDVIRYLDTWADRFDLLSSTVPFLQVADLRTAKGEVSELSKLVADVPNGAPFFTGRSGEALARLGFAEAARWLVHCQAFDPSGIKTGAVGDPRVKGGRGYPIGTAWCGAIGAVVLEGRSLHETLLLNLPLTRDNGDALPSEDRPVWERTPLTETEENGGGRVPVGPADLLTWPSRRVRLVHDDRAVTGVLICNGDPCQQQDAFAEPMTAWRRSETQEKKLGRPTVYMPASHDAQRSLWRGLAALLPLDMDAAPHTGAPRSPSSGCTGCSTTAWDLTRTSLSGPAPSASPTATRAQWWMTWSTTRSSCTRSCSVSTATPCAQLPSMLSPPRSSRRAPWASSPATSPLRPAAPPRTPVTARAACTTSSSTQPSAYGWPALPRPPHPQTRSRPGRPPHGRQR